MQIHELNNFNGTPGATNFLAIDDGSDTSRISGEALLDPVNSRIDNLTANVLPDSVETILDWADVESASKTLTKNVSGFDYLDLYFKEVTSGTNRIVFAQRYPRTAFPAQVTIPVISWGGGTDPKYLYFQDLMIAISGTTLTMSQLRIYSWDGKAADGANINTGILVDQIRVDGVKISSNTSAELTDLRTAHNGTVYASARAAREADYNALDAKIVDLQNNLYLWKRVTYVSNTPATQKVYSNAFKKGMSVNITAFDFSQDTTNPYAIDMGFIKTGDSTLYQRTQFTSSNPSHTLELTDNYDYVQFYRNEAAANCSIDILTNTRVIVNALNELEALKLAISGQTYETVYNTGTNATQLVYSASFKKDATVKIDAFDFSQATTSDRAFQFGFRKTGDSRFYQLNSITSTNSSHTIILTDDYDFLQYYRNETAVNCTINTSVLGVEQKLEELEELEDTKETIFGKKYKIVYASGTSAEQKLYTDSFKKDAVIEITASDFSQETTNPGAIQFGFRKTGDSAFYHLTSITSASPNHIIELTDDYDYVLFYRNETAVNCNIDLTIYGLEQKTDFINEELKQLEQTIPTQNVQLKNEYFKSIMRVGVIGDSLSIGHIENGHTQTANTVIYGWPRQIMQDTQGEWINFGFSGASTRSWLTNPNGLTALLNGGKCQIYIIGLGVNDSAGSSTPPALPLGSIADINASDPDLNPDTYYGNYGKIISKVHAYAPEAKFILLTSPRLYNATYTPQFNQAVRDIAALNYWGEDTVFLCDLRNDYLDLFQTDAISSQQHGWHYTAEGYAALAKMMEIAISNVLRNNSAFALIDEIEYDSNN